MNNRVISLIVFLMCISFLGIIGLQAYWIRLKALENMKAFDQDVQKTLAAIQDQLEDREAFVFIQDANEIHAEIKAKGPKENHREDYTYTVKVDGKTRKNQPRKKRIIQKNVSIISSNIDQIIIEHSEPDEGFVFESLDSSKLIDYFVYKKNKLDKAVNRIALDFAFRDISLEERLSKLNLDSIINQNLSEKGFQEMDYNYWVIDPSNDSVIKGTSLSGFNDNKVYATRILKDESENGGILNLQFSERTKRVIESIWWSLISAIVLTLILFFTFLFTIRSILKQKKISQVKADFINNMTHEFKTPIATISLAVDSMLHPKMISEKKQIEHFGSIIKKENTRMNDQIERVLSLAKFEQNEFELNLEEVDVHQILKELLENFKLKAAEESGQFDLKLKADRHIVVADRMHLYNAFRNIISNAINYSENAFKIQIESTIEGNYISIAIQDEGIGMDDETLKHVFDRFYRKSQGDLHKVKGFGLGLHYVKEIIDRLEGQISVESELKKGSTFHIKLPLA